jgi:hypothetical protein
MRNFTGGHKPELMFPGMLNTLKQERPANRAELLGGNILEMVDSDRVATEVAISRRLRLRVLPHMAEGTEGVRPRQPLAEGVEVRLHRLLQGMAAAATIPIRVDHGVH